MANVSHGRFKSTPPDLSGLKFVVVLIIIYFKATGIPKNIFMPPPPPPRLGGK